VKDDAGHTFGAFVPFPWKNAKGFYGTGECFVFKMAPTFKVRAPQTASEQRGNTLKDLTEIQGQKLALTVLYVPFPWENAKGFYGTGECLVLKLASTFTVCAPAT